jgi:hypothetical protein
LLKRRESEFQRQLAKVKQDLDKEREVRELLEQNAETLENRCELLQMQNE